MTRAEQYQKNRQAVVDAIDEGHAALQEMEPEKFRVKNQPMMSISENGTLTLEGNRGHLDGGEVAAMLEWLKHWFEEEV